MCKMNTRKYKNSTLPEHQKASGYVERSLMDLFRELSAATCILLTCLLFSTFQMRSATIKDDFLYKNLNSDKGLSQNFVDYIYQDSEGFLWFATWGGLDRFDGYEVKKYNIQNHLLHTNFTHCIEEDSYSRLWVGTDLGVSIIDLHTGRNSDCLADYPQYKQLLNTSVHAILKDKDGKLWIAGDHGLACLVFDNEGGLKNFYSLNISPVQTIAEDQEGRIWLGMVVGQMQILSNKIPGQFIFEQVPPGLQTKNSIKKIFPDRMGTFWIGTSDGLIIYNPHTRQIDHFAADPLQPGMLQNGFINDIVQDKRGRIWIATLAGLALWEPETKSFQRIQSDGTPGSINNNFLNTLFVDNQNILWIGTEKGGVNWMYQKRKVFQSYMHSPQDPSSLFPAPVNSIFEDSKSRLWVGQVEGGLHVRIPGTSSFKHYVHTAEPSSLSQNTISKIIEDSKRHIWVATWGGGLNQMNVNEKDFIRYKVDGKPGSLADIFISDLCEDIRNQGIWVGSSSCLQFFDYRTQKFTTKLTTPNVKYPPSQVNALKIDNKRRLWIATNFGLYCVFLDKSDVRTNKFKFDYFRNELNDPKSDHLAKIISILEDKNGKLWFGSNGNGLYLMEERTKESETNEEAESWQKKDVQHLDGNEVRFHQYDQKNGLVDNVIYTILEDETGKIWMSTNNGLCRFTPSTGQGACFYKSDGLLSNQFYWMAACKSRDGRLYFGNIEGMNAVVPSRIQTNDYMPTVKLISLQVLNEPVEPGVPLHGRIYLQKQLFDTHEIVLPQRDKSFSFDFSTFDFESPEKIRYAYMLEGFDANWVEVDATRRFVHYTNLKQGHYIFKVRCTNSDGVWSDHLTSLKIYIKPPFYQTFLFRFMMFLLLSGLIWYIISNRVRKLKEEQLILENKVHERTLKIEQQKDQLREQAVNLEKTLSDLMVHEQAIIQQNDLLKVQNEQILEQKEQLESYNLKVEELNQEKMSIFTNITHEFKTPITLIMGPIQRMLHTSTDPTLVSQLQLVERNSKQLLSLVNQLMDFRKVEAGAMTLNKSQGNIVELAREILIPFGDMVEKRGVQCSLSTSISNPVFLYDTDKLGKIITNLLSNAVKFTPDNGNITVRMSEVDKSGTPWLRLTVSDSGSGIPEEEFEKIFDRFYQIKGQQVYQTAGQSGTGIGLYLCRELAALHGGTIYAMNNRVGGARFVLEIPVERLNNSAVETRTEPEKNIKQQVNDLRVGFSEHKPVLLMVEDNPDMRQFVRSFMENDFNIMEASDGVEAWELTQQYLPDFIVSDVMMPKLDGNQFCRLVKNNLSTSHIPVILLTALSSVEKQLEGLESGADDFVSKPFEEKVLMARVRNILESRNRLHERFKDNMSTTTLNMDDDSPDKRLLDKALKILQDNYQNPDFDVTELIQEIGISRSLLHKKLDTLVGQSASRFIRGFRLTKAKEMLEKAGGRNISEIAYAVGFNDPKYFTRCFTKHFGVNPSSWEK
jgi:signal transduction histidine kinase/ligand-binding sensor domain-containing protein/CheY-like chemotaxis protein